MGDEDTCDNIADVSWELRESNNVWETCIDGKTILYITPVNQVIKSVESLQIPHFRVKNADGTIAIYKIKIDKKYVNCFLRISGKWYAILRLSGHTLNVTPLASTTKLRAYFELRNFIFDTSTGLISFTPDSFQMIEEKQLLLSTSSAPILQLKEGSCCCIQVEKYDRKSKKKANDYLKLQKFRQHKIFGNLVKRQALLNGYPLVFALLTHHSPRKELKKLQTKKKLRID